MINLDQLLTEVNERENLLTEGVKFYQYKALVRIKYTKDPEYNMGAEKLAEILRAIPSATRVSTASLDRTEGVGIFNVRLISQKSPKEAFIAFKKNCLTKFKRIILKVEIAVGSIETKNFVK